MKMPMFGASESDHRSTLRKYQPLFVKIAERSPLLLQHTCFGIFRDNVDIADQKNSNSES